MKFLTEVVCFANVAANAPRYLASILFKMATSTVSARIPFGGMMLCLKRSVDSDPRAGHGSVIENVWEWAKRPDSLLSYLAATPSLDCMELFIVHRCSHDGGDGIAFIMCDKEGATCVMKQSYLEDRLAATAALQSEASMLLRAWPRRLSDRVYVANWKSIPFLCMPLLRIISSKDSADLGIDVETAVRAHIDELATRGLCHDDLHWRHVACYKLKNEQPRIVFIDWARFLTDMEAEEARRIMLHALDLDLK